MILVLRQAATGARAVPLYFTTQRRRPLMNFSSEAEEAVHLEDEGAVLQLRHAGHRGVAAVVVDEEDLATRVIFPPHAQVGAERVVARVVLEQAADEHHRRNRPRDARADQLRREVAE